MKISVICVYNDKSKLQSQLKESLDTQDIEFELIAVDNTAGAYHSAAAALNSGGGYLMVIS